jgi:hypothetical protein
MLPVAVPTPAPRAAASAVEDIFGPQPLPSAPPGFMMRAFSWLQTRILRAGHLVGPPQLRVLDLARGALVTPMLGLVCRYRIADHLANGPLTAAELAARTGLDADALHRYLRSLAHLGVFSLQRGGTFTNNRYSNVLRDQQIGSMRDCCLYFVSESNLRAWNDIDETARSGKNAFERLHGMSLWDWFARHSDEAEIFGRVMMASTLFVAPTIATIYPWRTVGSVCDVGGGSGILLSELLVRHPHLQGVLCESAGLLDSARALLDKRGVLHRVQLAPGSFFDHVPSGADAYLLKNVLHDWDDARALRILEVVRRAMEYGQRLVIAENVLAPDDTVKSEAIGDVHVMTVCSEGRERSRAEYVRLLERSGFRLGHVDESSPLVNILEGIAS